MSRDDQDAQTHDGSLARLSLLAEALPPLSPRPDTRDQLLTQLRGPERWTPWTRELARLFALQEDDVRAALRRICDPAAWRPGPWPGSTVLLTQGLLAARTLITRLPARLRIPSHRHEERELTYVLDGVLLSDQTSYGTGALLEMLPGSEHTVTIGDGSACLVVFAPIPRVFLANR